MIMNKGRIRPKGMALITALMVLVILGIIAGCFAMVMNRDARQARISSYQIICLNAAQAGIDYALWLHKHNLAFYPVVDYSQNISRSNMLPMNNAYNNQKQVYPAKGSIYNLPMAGLSNATKLDYYTPVKDRMGTYKNQANSYKEWDTEYLFVNDLSFWTDDNGNYDNKSPDNFMHESPYIVTFQIREGVEKVNNKNEYTLHLVSTGKLRSVPDGYDWLAKGNNWTNFADTLSDGTSSTGLSSRRLEELGFTEYASRTVAADYVFDTVKGGYPSIVSKTIDENLPVNRQYQMPERKKREWFR